MPAAPPSTGLNLARRLGMANKTQIPPEFEELPEPGRSKAFELLQELLDAGEGERDAVQQALQRAHHWIAERAKPTQ